MASDLVVAAADTTSLTALWAVHLAAREGEDMQEQVWVCTKSFFFFHTMWYSKKRKLDKLIYYFPSLIIQDFRK